jgi:hypothetical protein
MIGLTTSLWQTDSGDMVKETTCGDVRYIPARRAPYARRRSTLADAGRVARALLERIIGHVANNPW